MPFNSSPHQIEISRSSPGLNFRAKTMARKQKRTFHGDLDREARTTPVYLGFACVTGMTPSGLTSSLLLLLCHSLSGPSWPRIKAKSSGSSREFKRMGGIGV